MQLHKLQDYQALTPVKAYKGSSGSFSIMFECRGPLLCACIVALLVSTAVAAPTPKLGTTGSVARNIKWQYQLSDEGVITKLPVSSLLLLASNGCTTSVGSPLDQYTTAHTATANRHSQSATLMHDCSSASTPLRTCWYRSGAFRASDGASGATYMCALTHLMPMRRECNSMTSTWTQRAMGSSPTSRSRFLV